MSIPIEDYALIGDTQTAALVARNGSIDWLCLPRFDSPACFAALLGDSSHGRWLIAPAGAVRRVARRYRGNSLVLETEFTTADRRRPRGRLHAPARARLPISCASSKACAARSTMQHGADRPLRLRIDRAVGAAHRRRVARDRRARRGVAVVAGASCTARTSRTRATFTVARASGVQFLLMWHPSHEGADPPLDAEQAVEDTVRLVGGVVRAVHLRGRVARRRAAIADHAQGADLRADRRHRRRADDVAAGTDRRRAQLGLSLLLAARRHVHALRAARRAASRDEAAAWRAWLLRAVAGDPADLQIMYGPRGERRLTELELPWLPGYESSKPVRIGNAAVDQLQLDVYGEVMDALYVALRAGVEPDDAAWALQRLLIEFLETALEAARRGHLGGARPAPPLHALEGDGVGRRRPRDQDRRRATASTGPVERWRDAARRDPRGRRAATASTRTRNAFTQYYGVDRARRQPADDAAGRIPAADDPRVAGHDRGDRARADGRRLRAPLPDATPPEVDGLPPGEGAFLPCTFWLADNYALHGRDGRGARSCSSGCWHCATIVGLLSEEYDPRGRAPARQLPAGVLARVAGQHRAEPDTDRMARRTISRGPRSRAVGVLRF